MAANKAFRRLLARVEELKAENENLLYERDEAYAAEERYQERMTHDRKIYQRRLDDERYEREAAESRERNRQWDRHTAIGDLERAKEWGDSWECERALRRLKAII